jgi:hypothetical protein
MELRRVEHYSGLDHGMHPQPGEHPPMSPEFVLCAPLRMRWRAAAAPRLVSVTDSSQYRDIGPAIGPHTHVALALGSAQF